MAGSIDTDVDPIIPTITPEEAGITGGGGGSVVATTCTPIACTYDRFTPLVVGEVRDWMVPYAMTVQKITASLTLPSSSGNVVVDVKRNGTTVFSTPMTIEASETTTLTAATQSSISVGDWAEGDIITVHVTSAGTGAAGLTIYPTTGAQAVDAQAPTAPTSLSATASGSTTVDLTWVASDDDTGVSSYRIQRATNSSFTGATSITVGNVTSYTVTGLTPTTPYYFRVAAKDAANNQSDWSNTDSDTTGAFSPSELSWLGYHDAQQLALSNGASVTSFTDQSGHAKHFATDAGVGGDQTAPTFATSDSDLAGKHAVVFGSDSNGLRANWGATGQGTLWIVGHFNPTNDGNRIIILGNYLTDTNFQIFTNTDNTFSTFGGGGIKTTAGLAVGKHIIRLEFRATETRTFVDGVDVTDDATATTKPGAWVALGHAFGVAAGFKTSKIGIVAYSDGLVTGTTADACEDFWAAFYGITLP